MNQPPFNVVGALPLDDFFPQRERQGLMIRLNGLIASPKFQAWRTGEALDPAQLLPECRRSRLGPLRIGALGGDPGRKAGGVEVPDRTDRRAAGGETAPEGLDFVAER